MISGRKLLAAALLATVSFAASSGMAQDAKPLKIGLLLSLSGPAASFGIPERDAAELIVAGLNSQGGVDGRKIELAIYDDTTNPTEAARGATKLIREDGVVAIVGASTGSGTLAAAPIAAREKIPMLAPNATISVTARDSQSYPYVFRTMSNDIVNTKRLYEAAIAGGAKKVAIFYQEDAYGKDSATYVKKLAEERGMPIVDMASAPLKSIDVAAQAVKLRGSSPDAVIMQVTAPALGGAFVRAAKQVGLDVPIWGSMGLGQKSFIESSGAAGNGIRLVVFGNWDDPSPRQAKLADVMKAGGKAPQGFAELISTNGLLAIVEAARKIKGDITGPALRDELEKLCKVTTYSDGELCYSKDDHDGWSADALTTVEIRDGAFKRVQ